MLLNGRYKLNTMKKIFLNLLMLLVVLSCVTKPKSYIESKEKATTTCAKTYTNNYTKIVFGTYKTIVGNDTISYNEIRYECVSSSFATHKVMYDKFGNWNQYIYPKDSKVPILLWRNIDLFEDGNKYTIYTFGSEEWKHIYATIMVFDDKENDVLENDEMRTKVATYFGKLIKRNNSSKKKFYGVFNKLKLPIEN